MAAKKGQSVPQIALAYILKQSELNVFALVGSATGDEFRTNAAAFDINLTPQERDYLDLRTDSPDNGQ